MLGEANNNNKIRSLWPQMKCLTNEAEYDIIWQLSEWRFWQRFINVLFIPEPFNQKAGHRLSGGMNANGCSWDKNYPLFNTNLNPIILKPKYGKYTILCFIC